MGSQTSPPPLPETVLKWSLVQASRAIKRHVREHGELWLTISHHASERMVERSYSVEDVYETVLSGKPVRLEPGEHPVHRTPSIRITFELERRTYKVGVVVALTPSEQQGVVATVLSQQRIRK